MEINILIFIIQYKLFHKEIKAFVEIGSDEKNLYLKIEDNSKVIGIYRLIIWQKKNNKRIYIHDRYNSYKQLGYIDVQSNKEINFIGTYCNEESIEKYILTLIHLYLFNIDKWMISSKIPIILNLEGIDLQISQFDDKRKFVILNNFKKFIEDKEKQTSKSNNNITTVKNIISIEEKKPVLLNKSNNNSPCYKCRYRKECVRRSKVNGICDDFSEGAAYLDYEQWS